MDRVLAVVCNVLLAGPLVAGAATEGAPPSPLAVEVSGFVLSRDTWSKMQRSTAEQAKQQIARNLGRSGTSVPPEFSQRFDEEFGKILTYDEVIDIQARLLGRHYTASELKGLLAFYKTPLGQKLIRVMPEVTQEASSEMLSLYKERLPHLVERLKPTLEGSGPAAAQRERSGPAAPQQGSGATAPQQGTGATAPQQGTGATAPQERTPQSGAR
jgi:hypothetical protein